MKQQMNNKIQIPVSIFINIDSEMIVFSVAFYFESLLKEYFFDDAVQKLMD